MAKKMPEKKEGVFTKAAHAIADAIGGDHERDVTSHPPPDAPGGLSKEDEKKIDEIFTPPNDQPKSASDRGFQNHPKFSKFNKGN